MEDECNINVGGLLNKSKHPLEGKTIVHVNDDVNNEIIFTLDDGSTIVIEAYNSYVGNGLSISTLRIR